MSVTERLSSAELVHTYALAHYDYNNISADRRRQQPQILLAFAAVCDKPLDEMTGPDLRHYLSTRLASGMAPTTLGKHLAMIRPFYEWLYDEGLVTSDQLLGLRRVKPPRGAFIAKPRPYSEKEVRQLWRDLETHYPWTLRHESREVAERFVDRWQRGSSPWRRARPYATRLQIEAVTALALYGGLRRDEIFRLEVDAMHYDNAYVLVTGARKNAAGEHPQRAVPWVVPQMRAAVQEWLDFREVVLARAGVEHQSPWLSLVTAAPAVPLTTHRFVALMRRAGPWQFHRLRHTAATEMLRSGMPLHIVQRILGHAQIQQTLAYAELVPDDVVQHAARSGTTLARRMERMRAG